MQGLLGSIHEDKNALGLLALGEETSEEEAESDNQVMTLPPPARGPLVLFFFGKVFVVVKCI